MAKLPTKLSILISMFVCSGVFVMFLHSRTNVTTYDEDDLDTFDDGYKSEGSTEMERRPDLDDVDEMDEMDEMDEIDDLDDLDDLDNLDNIAAKMNELPPGDGLSEGSDMFPDIKDMVEEETEVASQVEQVDFDPSMFSTTLGTSTQEMTTDDMTTGTTPVTTEDPTRGARVGKSGARKNVLLLMTDDMRPQLGSFSGSEDFPMPYHKDMKMYTPNLDALAAQSILFKRAYVQYSLCGPSRTSMLTSRRPDTTRIFGNNNYWRDKGGNFTTLPQHFKEQGYTTIGIGKIFHKGKSSDKNDKKYSWSEKYYMPPYTDNHYIPNTEVGAGWRSVTAKETKKVPLSDEYSVMKAKEYLRKLAPKAATGKQPFFMGVGFKKPHLSLVCPEKFFEMYPLEKEEQYLPDKEWQTPSVKDTVGMGDDAGDDGPRKVIPDAAMRHLRRAYFACVSYVDSLVGEIVRELDDLGLADSTIVTFVADHGYHLGENAHWGKVTNYERATHVPLMIRIPGQTDRGIQTRALVEAVDLYPTLVQAAGLSPIPRCPVHSAKIDTCTDGKSLLHLVDNPTHHHKKIIYSQIASGGQFMSYTIRTDRFRFVEWAEVKKSPRPDGLWDIYMDWQLSGWQWWTGFFDLKLDPEERFNVTADPRYSNIQLKMRNKLHNFVDKIYESPKHFVKGH